MAVTIKSKDGNPSGVVRLFPVKLSKEAKMVIQDNMSWEDQFSSFYWTSKYPQRGIVVPPFNPVVLMSLAYRNNTLPQCIEVYEVNIDGTGFSVEKKEIDGPDNPKEKELLEDFFSNPWPDETITTLRRQMRFDEEATGNGYIEVLQNLARDVVGLRYLDSTMMRLVRLDAPVDVEKILIRNGNEETIKVSTRERRFAQMIGEKLLFFREYGTSRELNRETGEWESTTTPVSPELRASQVLHFTVMRDIKTGYGVPRWINELPNIIASRKAEEQNLEFFEAGGVPPVVVFVAGGSAATDVVDQLEGWFSPGAKNKHRVAVVSVQSSSGSLDAPGKVEIKAERFGDSRGDTMFKEFGATAEKNVQGAFRLPPIFFGQSDSYNFATAMTAYMVTEAQVFGPERKEFDDIINMTIVKALGVEDYEFKSKPITLKNVELMLQGLESVKDKISGEEFVKTVNEITGIDAEYDEEAEAANKPPAPIIPGAPVGGASAGGARSPAPKPGVGLPPRPAQKSGHWTPLQLISLAGEWVVASGLEEGEMDIARRAEILETAESLESDDRTIFEYALSGRTFTNTRLDPDGLAAIAGFAAARTMKTDKDCCPH